MGRSHAAALIVAVALMAMIALVVHDDASTTVITTRMSVPTGLVQEGEARLPTPAEEAQLKNNYNAAENQATQAAKTSDEAMIRAAQGHAAAESQKADPGAQATKAAKVLRQAATVQEQEASGAAKMAEDKEDERRRLKDNLDTVEAAKSSDAAQKAALKKAVIDAAHRADADSRAAVAKAEAKAAAEKAAKETAAAEAADASNPMYLELQKKYHDLQEKDAKLQQDDSAEKDTYKKQIQDQQAELSKLRGMLRDGAETIHEAKQVEQGAIPPVPQPDPAAAAATTILKKELAEYKAKLEIAEDALQVIDNTAEQKLSDQDTPLRN
jgi:hypothetical protein